MTRSFRRRALAAGACAFASVAVAVPASATPRPASASSVREVPVSFAVRNVNRSKLACPTDGAAYTVRGHLVGTRAALRNPRATSLYLHGLGFGEFFWRYREAPGYDFASGMARRGNVSVVIDRLGYGSSGHPNGGGSCLGGQADVAHQIVGQLRSGAYRGAAHPRFGKVALVGHSAGGLTAQVEAYSFGDVDALGVLAYADQGISTLQRNAGAMAARVCDQGGLPPFATSPASTYTSLGPTRTMARGGFFSSTPHSVFSTVFPNLSHDPCGDVASYMAAPPTNIANVGSIRVPVMVLQASRDALFPPPAGQQQAARFTGSRRVTYRSLAQTAHALTFERGRVVLQRDLDSWLSASGIS